MQSSFNACVMLKISKFEKVETFLIPQYAGEGSFLKLHTQLEVEPQVP